VQHFSTAVYKSESEILRHRRKAILMKRYETPVALWRALEDLYKQALPANGWSKNLF
jgi:hypothetical protein